MTAYNTHLIFETNFWGEKSAHYTRVNKVNKENIRYTWKLITKAISTKKVNNQYTIKKPSWDNRIYVDKQSICDQLNNHFISVGNGLADKLPKHHIDPLGPVQTSNFTCAESNTNLGRPK